MKNTSKTVLLVFTLVLISVQLFAQEAYNLTYKYEKGKTYFYSSNSTVESVKNVQGQEFGNKTNSKIRQRMEVTDVTPIQFEIITSLDSLNSKTENSMGGDDNINNGEGVIGKRTKIIYNQFGEKIKELIIDAVAKGNNEQSNGSLSLLVKLPGKAIKAGETWSISKTDTTKNDADNKTITKTVINYKIEGKDKFKDAECLKISFNSSSKIEGSMTNEGTNIILTGTSKVNGIFLFDNVKGLLLSIDSGRETNMTAEIPEQGISIPITKTEKTKTVLTDK